MYYRANNKLVLALAALMIACTGYAQESANTATTTSKQRPSSSRATTASASLIISGKIADVKDTKVRRGTETNKVILLETAKGHNIAVDLGAASRLQDVEVSKGFPLTVRGKVATIMAKPVLIADAITAGDKQLVIKRSTKTRQQRQTQQSKQFQGEISKMRDIKVRGFQQPHTVAILNIENNKQLYIDLGPTDQLEKASLKAGEKVTVKGSPMKVKGRAVLAVTHLQANGQTIDIKRNRI